MANVKMYGFRHVGSLTGESPKALPIRVASGYSSAIGANIGIHPGDPVIKLTDGTCRHATAAGGNQIYGIVAGIGPLSSSSLRSPWDNYLPYGTIQTSPDLPFVYVIPAAEQLFECDVYATNASYDTYSEYVAYIGANLDMTYSGAVAPKLWPMLDMTTASNTSTLQWRIVDVSKRIDQDFASDYVKLIVTVNVTQQAPWQTTGLA